jgi:hypothetical protein
MMNLIATLYIHSIQGGEAYGILGFRDNARQIILSCLMTMVMVVIEGVKIVALRVVNIKKRLRPGTCTYA